MSDFETMGEEVLGADVLGDEEDMATVGAALKRLPARKLAKAMLTVRRPNWRSRLAPGVPQPGYGLEPLPLVPDTNGGIFTAAVAAIQFVGRPQRPFRPERLITNVRRSGAAGSLIFATGIFAGTNLQQVQRGNLNIENFGPTAFGVRLSMVQVEPGVDFAIPCIVAPVPGGADTVAVSIDVLGHTAR